MYGEIAATLPYWGDYRALWAEPDNNQLALLEQARRIEAQREGRMARAFYSALSAYHGQDPVTKQRVTLHQLMQAYPELSE